MSIEVRGVEEAMLALPKVNTRRLLAAGAAEYKARWRDHFGVLDAAGNKRGLPAKHFWLTEGRQRTDVAEVTQEKARVTCDSRAVAFKAVGVVIRPRDAQALAVPMSPEAYMAGWPANSGLPLEFVRIRSRKNPRVVGKLVEAWATQIGYRRKDGKAFAKGDNRANVGRTHYLLLSESPQQPMGDAVMPDVTSAAAAVDAKVAEALARQLERGRE